MPRYRQIQPKYGPEKAFGMVLREIRESAGLSQMDVHVQFDIDRTYLSAIERGIQSPQDDRSAFTGLQGEALRDDSTDGSIPILQKLN